jgi:hypothetical protein
LGGDGLIGRKLRCGVARRRSTIEITLGAARHVIGDAEVAGGVESG